MPARKPLPFLAIALLYAAALLPRPLPAQDLAAAARANRARKEATKSAFQENNPWFEPTHAFLSGNGPGDSSETWYQLSANGDMQITVKYTETGKTEIAELMLIHGKRQWMLTKNVPLEEGYEIDVLDGPVLDLQMALQLLQIAIPSGPTTISEKTTKHIREEQRPVSVTTPSASGGLDPPWVLRATVEPLAQNKWAFELIIELPAEGGEPMKMHGTWQKQPTPPTLSDDMPLETWQILTIGPIRREADGGGTIYDYGAQPSTQRARTLGELRKM